MTSASSSWSPALLPQPPDALVPPVLPPIDLAPLHLGPLHPLEQGLVLVIAFGPFVVLGIVVAVLRRRDVAAERREQPPEGEPAP